MLTLIISLIKQATISLSVYAPSMVDITSTIDFYVPNYPGEFNIPSTTVAYYSCLGSTTDILSSSLPIFIFSPPNAILSSIHRSLSQMRTFRLVLKEIFNLENALSPLAVSNIVKRGAIHYLSSSSPSSYDTVLPNTNISPTLPSLAPTVLTRLSSLLKLSTLLITELTPPFTSPLLSSQHALKPYVVLFLNNFPEGYTPTRTAPLVNSLLLPSLSTKTIRNDAIMRERNAWYLVFGLVLLWVACALGAGLVIMAKTTTLKEALGRSVSKPVTIGAVHGLLRFGALLKRYHMRCQQELHEDLVKHGFECTWASRFMDAIIMRPAPVLDVDAIRHAYHDKDSLSSTPSLPEVASTEDDGPVSQSPDIPSPLNDTVIVAAPPASPPLRVLYPSHRKSASISNVATPPASASAPSPPLRVLYPSHRKSASMSSGIAATPPASVTSRVLYPSHRKSATLSSALQPSSTPSAFSILKSPLEPIKARMLSNSLLSLTMATNPLESATNTQDEEYTYWSTLRNHSFCTVGIFKKRRSQGPLALGDLVVLRMIKKPCMAVGEARTLEEARAMRCMRESPWALNLLATFETGMEEFFVLPYFRQGPISNLLLHFGGCFPRNIANFYMAELIIAIQTLHRAGIIHRDIKQSNLLIDDEGHLVIGDFGYAKIFNMSYPDPEVYPYWAQMREKDGNFFPILRATADNPLTDNYICGRALYSAPEIFREEPYSFGVDYYSAAVVYYAMILGFLPFTEAEYSGHDTFMPVLDLCSDVHKTALTEDEREFFTRMLSPLPNHRLTLPSLKMHPVFKEIKWRKIEERSMPIPFTLPKRPLPAQSNRPCPFVISEDNTEPILSS